jgi:hypothetical protein
LSPYFRIPSVHTKEPEYVDGKQIEVWLGEASVRERQNSRVDTGDPASLDMISRQKDFWDVDPS